MTTAEPTRYDPAIYSNSGRTVYDDDVPENATGRWQPFTWREVVEQQEQEIARLRKFERLVSDLDRNEHGRHEGDADVGDPTGVSQGNPLGITTGQRFAYDIGGRPYVMPERGKRHDPDAWGAR